MVRREFRLSKPDEPAYVIAGKYLEQRAAMGHWDIVFWTFAPLDADPQGTLRYGLIAEEVATVSPELVVRDQSGRIDGVRVFAVAGKCP